MAAAVFILAGAGGEVRDRLIDDIHAAALILLQHHWAVPLRDAIARGGGFRLGDGFICPLDLSRPG